MIMNKSIQKSIKVLMLIFTYLQEILSQNTANKCPDKKCVAATFHNFHIKQTFKGTVRPFWMLGTKVEFITI